MKKKIQQYCVLSIALGLLLFFLASLWIMDKQYTAECFEKLDNYLNLIAMDQPQNSQNPEEWMNNLKAHTPDYLRITLIQPDGSILADSAYASTAMDNHINREEIQQAAAAGTGHSKRYSQTEKSQIIYVSKAYDNIIIRLSMPLAQTRLFTRTMAPLFLMTFFFILTLCTFIIHFFTNKMLVSFDHLLQHLKQKMNGKPSGIYRPAFEELRHIMLLFDSLSDEISTTIQALQEKNNEIQNIISAMEQGLILLDESFRMLMLNDKAKALFTIKEKITKKNILHYYRNADFHAALKKAKNSMQEETVDIQLYTQILRFFITPVKEQGFVVLISDVTEMVRLENMRKDFVANVSHELKTPLTSISGFSELIVNGLVTETDKIYSYNQRIYQESQRLIQLVEELLTLSAIESSNLLELQPDEPLQISSFAESIFHGLEPQMAKLNINWTATGELTLHIQQKHLYTLLYNLIENAIKYNRPGGSITLALFQTESHKCIRIRDTGIGIAQNELERIFERFYRVDKGRGQKISGTGLGLSIVKHIVILYQGRIVVESDEKGTEFTIFFPLAL